MQQIRMWATAMARAIHFAKAVAKAIAMAIAMALALELLALELAIATVMARALAAATTTRTQDHGLPGQVPSPHAPRSKVSRSGIPLTPTYASLPIMGKRLPFRSEIDRSTYGRKDLGTQRSTARLGDEKL